MKFLINIIEKLKNKEELRRTISMAENPEKGDLNDWKDKDKKIETKSVEEVLNNKSNIEKTEPERKSEQENEQRETELKDNEQKKPQEKKVIIHAKAYKSIILYATRYANSSIRQEEWREIYGILVGVHSDDAVIVERAIPMTFGESHDVELGAKHYGFIAEIQDQLDAEGRGRFMVGWFHSHPGLSLFFSYVDVMNQLSFAQPNPDFIGIVFDHTYLLDSDLKPQSYSAHPSPANPNYNITEDYDTHPFKTGIVCYRLNDPFITQDNPKFDTNYHDVPYEILGLDQYFFANLLTELSSQVAKGRPLETAYREPDAPPSAQPKAAQADLSQNQGAPLGDMGWKSDEREIDLKEIEPPKEPSEELSQRDLQKIPLTGPPEELSAIPGVLPSEKLKKTPEESKLDNAMQLITEGKTAFLINDSFSAVEKYNQALKILDELGNKYIDRMLDTYVDVAESCLESKHENLAIKFAKELKEKAENVGDMFQMANADFIYGNALLKKESTQEGLEHLKNAAILYENAGDLAGVGKVNEEIAKIYLDNGDYTSGALFLIEAMQNYKKAIEKFHVKRRSSWALPANLRTAIEKMKEKVRKYMEKIDSDEVKNKIKNDLRDL
ncbi:MAG: hypothetical protein GF364_17250 [Candidatus Lokiarchaeota archaeon]|nr:hypothetical protein [Candidatus Lokiarchaeota archaeon]